MLLTACAEERPAAPTTDDGLHIVRLENFVVAAAFCPEGAVGADTYGRLELYNRLTRPVQVIAIHAQPDGPVEIMSEVGFELAPLSSEDVLLRCRSRGAGANRQPLRVETSEGVVDTFVETFGVAPIALVAQPSAAVDVPYVEAQPYASVVSFRVFNVGNEALRLTRAPQLPPGMVARFDWSSASVGADKEATFELLVTPERTGRVDFPITLFTNDPRHPELSLTMSVNAVARGECKLSTELVRGARPLGPRLVSTVRFRSAPTVDSGYCDLSGLRVEDFGRPPMNLPQRWLRLQPGQTVDVDVTHSPGTAALTFFGNAADLQPARVSLTPVNHVPCLTPSPDAADLGTVRMSCSATRTVTIYNTCGGSFAVSVRPPAADSGFVISPAADFVLGYAPYVLTVTFKPSTIGAVQETVVLDVMQNGEQVSQVIALSARGDSPGWKTDIFSLPAQLRRDALIVVGTPALAQSDAGHYRRGLASLRAHKCADARILVARAGDGGVLMLPADGGSDPVINGIAADIWPEVMTRIETAAMGSDRSTLETAAALLTTHPKLRADGGFFRKQVASVSLLNDGTDSSPLPPDAYLQQIAASWPQLRTHVVAPFNDSTCTDGRADNGVLASVDPYGYEICSADWLSYGAYATAGCGLRSEFYLNATPYDPSVVTVERNGISVPRNLDGGAAAWTYDPVGNSIIFQPGILDYEDTVKFVYTVGCNP